MANTIPAFWNDDEIIAQRPPKNRVDAARPYAFLVEPELTAEGRVEEVATIFLTNRECPFHCLMCDLWRNTMDTPVSLGTIPAQIDFALRQLPRTRHLKLYNSGNFFDAAAIPRQDFQTIADRLESFSTVIVENHPRLCDDACLRFRDQLAGQLEIALGLETVHPEILPALNKRMTLDDFSRATEWLVDAGIHVRAFVLLKPPWLDEDEGIDWAIRSVEFAFNAGARVCSIIPVRAGNGVLDRLQKMGEFHPPRLVSLERTMERALQIGGGRVFVDLWDAERFASCTDCAGPRIERLRRMNLQQQTLPAILCDCEVRT